MEDLKQPLLPAHPSQQAPKHSFFTSYFLSDGGSKRTKKSKMKKALSPQQTLLISKITDAETYILKNAETTVSTPFAINCLALSYDGFTLFYGSSNGNVSRYHKLEGKITDDVPLGYGQLYGICLDENNNRAAVCGESPIIRVFQLPRFELEFEFQGHTEQVNYITMNASHDLLYSASNDKTVRRWDMNKKTAERVIITHGGAAKCVAVTLDDRFVFSGGDDSLIRVFDNEFQEEVLNLKSHTGCVWSLATNPKSTCLASGGEDHKVIVWNIKDFTPLVIYTDHTDRIKSLAFSADSCFLVSGSADFTIKVWDLDKERREVTLNAHVGQICDLLISPEQDFIISCSDDKSVKVWSFPQFLEEEVFKALGNNFTSVALTDKTKCVVSCGSDKAVRFWDPATDEASLLLTSHGCGLKTCCSPDEKYMAVGDELGWLYVVNLKTKTLRDQAIQAHRGPIRDMCFTSDSTYLITGGGDSVILVWHIGTMENTPLKGHQQSIWSVCVSHDGETVISGSSDKTLRVWNVKTGSQRYCIQAQEQITTIAIDMNDRYIISGSSMGVVKIWNIFEKNQETIFKQHKDYVTSIYVLKDNETLLTSSKDKTIQIFSLKYRIPLTFLTRKQPILSMAVSSDEKLIVTGELEMIYLQENPLSSPNPRVLGPEENKQKFLTYMKSLINDIHPQHDPDMDSFIILPEFLNTLHFYAFLNYKEYLSASLSQKSAPIIPSKDGFHPLSICLLREMKGVRDEVVSALCKIGKLNPFILQMLENDLVDMNKKGFSLLGDLYDVIYQEANRRSLPKFCDKDADLPIVHISEHCRVRPEDFLDESMLSSQGMGITFYESYVRINFVMGSKESIDFLESLADCPNLDVLRSDLVQEIINYKWETARYTMMYQGGMFFTYMITLCIYTAFYIGNFYFQIVLSVVNMFLLFYECFQMMISGASYFEDIWNYVDWGRGMFMFIYLTSEWFTLLPDLMASIFALATFLSWLRGITYFRLLTTTRYLINLLFQVAVDISGFLILLLYSTLAFTFLFIVLERKMEVPVMLDYLKISYNLVLGNFEGEDYNIIEWMCLTCALIINPIIMLNLLISIIGDTYERVLSDSVAADAKELLDMIIEVESMMFTRRNVVSKQYIQVCKEYEKENDDGGWEGKLRALQNTIDKINTSNQQNSDLAMAKLKEQDKFLAEQTSRLDQILQYTKRQ